MTSFTVGQATIARVEETYGPSFRRANVSGVERRDIQAEHAHWLAPNHYDAHSGLLKLSVHSWLFADRQAEDPDQLLLRQQQGQAAAAVLGTCSTSLISSGSPPSHPSARDRHGHVHAPAPRSCRLEHPAQGRPLGADVSECPLRHLQAGFRVFPEARHRPAGWGRPSRAPFANVSSRSSRPDTPTWSPVRTGSNGPSRDSAAPGRSATWCSSSKAAASARSSSATCSIICCRYLSALELPEELGRRAEHGEPPHGARGLRVDWGAGAARPCRRAVRRAHRGDRRGVQAAVLMRWRRPARRIPRVN